MNRFSVATPASDTKLAVVFVHLWLHVALGAGASAVLFTGALIASQLTHSATIDWLDVLHVVPALVLMSVAGATLMGVLRTPALRWIGQRARQQQWPLAWLLLASAALFLAPIAPVFLFGPNWRPVGIISLYLSAPFLVSYVVATYWLRQHFYILPQPK